MPAEGAASDSWTRVETADGSYTLFSARFGQTLHSARGAVAEARWVFLRGSGLDERLAAGAAARVLEVGFGTGLNFLLTADAACGHGVTVRYTALDRTLPPAGAVEGLRYDRHLARPQIARELRHALWDATPGTAGRIRVCGAKLDLRLGDATAAEPEAAAYDAIYHDAFSPDANPELWSEAYLASLSAALAPGGVLVTYTVAGAVRRRLRLQGLDVEKRPGPPGGKREMLWARRPPTSRG